MTTLGDGHNTAFLYERGGVHRIAELPGVTALGWGRVLDDISEASVTCMIPGEVDFVARRECCRILGAVHTWQHELVVFRNGYRVWEGPIIRVSEQGPAVTINAVDVLGWTRRRAHKGRVATGVFVVNELNAMLTAALTEADPNVLPYVQVIGAGTGDTIDREVKANSGYYAEDLDGLGDAGGNYTTVGRKIILWPDHLTLGRVSRLERAHHLAADVEVIEDGMLLGTRVAARNDQDQSAKSTVGLAIDAFYGLVEVITENATTKTVASLQKVANSTRKGLYPANLIVNVPDGSTLTCDAPFDIAELVPGVIVPIEARLTCRIVHADQLLSSVNVTQASGVESVAITLVPLTAAVVT